VKSRSSPAISASKNIYFVAKKITDQVEQEQVTLTYRVAVFGDFGVSVVGGAFLGGSKSQGDLHRSQLCPIYGHVFVQFVESCSHQLQDRAKPAPPASKFRVVIVVLLFWLSRF